MARTRNIILVGLMGAGKTTIGRQLSKRLHLQFHDSDRELEQRTGANIPLIFEIEGEAGFRAREEKMIDELTGLDGVVIATGGGAVLSEENRRRMKQRGRVVYLRAPLEQLLERTRRDRNRPLLQNVDPRRKLEELITVRDPLYRQVADLIIDTDHRTVRHVVNQICRHLAHA